MKPRRFGNLEAWVQCGDETEWTPLEPNAQPFPIKCDFFDGQGLLLVRTPGFSDKYQSTVFGGGRRRMFELQLQGTFKEPPGALFVGGELGCERMRISGLARLAARGTLAFVRAVAGAGLSYSFGDGEEKPHITAPLFSSMPMVARTGVLGEPMNLETPSERSKRRNAASHDEYLDGDLVSLSLNSAVVDATKWTAKVPGLPPLDLHRLWEAADLHLVVYALTEERHVNKKYMVQVRMRHHEDETDIEIESGVDTMTEEEDDDIFYETRQSEESFATAYAEAPPPPPIVNFTLCGQPKRLFANQMDVLLSGTPRGDACCEAWVSVVDSFDRRRRDYFVVTYRGTNYLRRRKGKPVASARAAAWYRDEPFLRWARLSLNERRRRRVDSTVSALAHKGTLVGWLSSASSADTHFLADYKFKKPQHELRSGVVARASSKRSWCEELCVLERSPTSEWALSFYDTQKTLRLRIALQDADVPVKTTQSVFLGYNAFELSTPDRVVVVVTSDADGWINDIKKARELPPEFASDEKEEDDSFFFGWFAKKSNQESLLRERLATPGDEWSSFRCILNSRDVFDTTPPDDLLALSERLVSRAYQLVGDAAHDPEQWRGLLDDAGKLRHIPFTRLSDLAFRGSNQGAAFWSNLYHALLAHAALVFGLPTKVGRFVRHFSMWCYEIAGDVVSLAEMEHSIVRAQLPRPKLLLDDLLRGSLGKNDLNIFRAALSAGQSALPSSPSPFALTRTDYRLIFALNPGALDTPETTRVFTPANLDAQILAACRDALDCATIDRGTIFLPRLCAWHDLRLEKYRDFLPADIKTALNEVDAGAVPPLKFAYFDFRFSCRFLNLSEEE